MIKKTELLELPNKQHLELANVCHHFGCGKHLTSTESLAGKFCIKHQKEKPVDIMKVLKFK